MYTCEIKVHDLHRINTEPVQLTRFSLPSLMEIMQEVNGVMIVADRKKMLDGYSITIQINKED